MTKRRSATALLAVLLAATAAPAQARKRPAERKLERSVTHERLGWHAPRWEWWKECDTVVYVVAGPDGIVAGTIQEGEKICPDDPRGALRRRPA